MARVSHQPQPPCARCNFAPSPAPPLQALTSCQSGRRGPEEQSKEQRDPAESRGGRPGHGHRGCRWGRGAAGCLPGGRTAPEPDKERGREAASEAGKAGAREGAADLGSSRSPRADARSAPRSLWPSCTGRGRASEEEPASERASVERAGGGRGLGPSLCRASAGEGGRGRAGSEREGLLRPGCLPPPLAAGPPALQSLTPIPAASWGPSVASWRRLTAALRWRGEPGESPDHFPDGEMEASTSSSSSSL